MDPIASRDDLRPARGGWFPMLASLEPQPCLLSNLAKLYQISAVMERFVENLVMKRLLGVPLGADDGRRSTLLRFLSSLVVGASVETQIQVPQSS